MTNRNTKKRKVKKKQKRYISSRFLWIILMISGIVFFLTFRRMPMFPKKWTYFVFAGTLCIVLLGFVLSANYKPRNRLVKAYNIVFLTAFTIASVLLPYETDRISELFDNLGGDITVNFYAISDEFKENHPSYKWNDDINNDSAVESLRNAVFITCSGTDLSANAFAQKAIKAELGVNDLVVMDRQNLSDAVDELYSGNADVLILNSAFQSLITDMNSYSSFKKDTFIIHSVKMPVTDTIEGDTELTAKPFSIFFGGNDDEGELSLYGRTDVDMIVSVNPGSHQISIINFPRDSYVPNLALDGEYDKLTHLGLSGLNNTLDGLSTVLETDINNYVLVNYTTFRVIIDSLGGIDVDNPYAFEADDGEYFEEGMIHLEGDPALMYVRERHHLPDGDFGRAMHQQIVMKAIIKKVTSKEMIVHFNNLLNSLNGTFLTNISSSALYSLVQKQLDEDISWNIVNYHLTGDFGFEYCASVYGEELSVIYPYSNQVDFVKELIDAIYKGDIIEQQELPEGYYYDEY